MKNIKRMKRFYNEIIPSEHWKNIALKVNALSISTSGIDEEGDPYVVLENGTKFFGSKYAPLIGTYRLLDATTKRVLKRECYQVAIDIVIRYKERGLMYGGPTKDLYYSLQDGNQACEMGAYQGFCSISLCQAVGPLGKVVAIEPMAENFRLLKKNKIANDLNQLEIVNMGVWDCKKILNFNIRKKDTQSSSAEMNYEGGATYSIEANTLDSIFLNLGINSLDLMIVQLNGAEINALRGLDRFDPLNLSIAARYDTEGVDAAVAIKEILEHRNYECEIVEDDFVFATKHVNS